MKFVTALVFMLACLVSAHTQVTYNFLTFGDTASNDRGSAAVADDEGFVYYAGSVSNGIGESDDIYFCKIDPDGNIIWQYFYGSEKHEFVNNMIRYDEDHFFICGDATDITDGNVNGFLLKVNTAGEEQWLVEYGFADKNEDFYGITKMSNGNIAVVGFHSADEGVGNDVLVVKYDTEGEIVQKVFFGEDVNDYGMGIVEGDNNSLFVSGDRIAFASSYNAFIAKIAEDGTVLWDHMNGFEFNNGCKTIMKNSAGNLMLVGESAIEVSPVFNIMVSEIDTAGNFLWTNWLGEAGAEAGYDISEPAPGNYFITGFGYNYVTLNNDIIIMHIDAAGNEISRSYYGGDGVDYAYDVQSNAAGDCWVTGFSNVQENIEFALIYQNFELVGIHGTENGSAESVIIAPNPAEYYLHIRSSKTIRSIDLMTVNGVFISSFEPMNDQFELMLPAGVSPGLYLLKFRGDNWAGTKKIIVK